MPKKRPGESQDDFMERCVPEVMNEGRARAQAVAICLDMYQESDEKED